MRGKSGEGFTTQCISSSHKSGGFLVDFDKLGKNLKKLSPKQKGD